MNNVLTRRANSKYLLSIEEIARSFKAESVIMPWKLRMFLNNFSAL